LKEATKTTIARSNKTNTTPTPPLVHSYHSEVIINSFNIDLSICSIATRVKKEIYEVGVEIDQTMVKI
jgi:hypothetical protein